jgi:translation initiation factor 1A
MLGNGRCECFCFDGVTRLGHIRGKMRKKVWITAGDIVLVGKRDFQDEKVDIIHKYTADEARNLKQYGELPENARINETAVDMAMADDNGDDDIGIAFDDIKTNSNYSNNNKMRVPNKKRTTRIVEDCHIN